MARKLSRARQIAVGLLVLGVLGAALGFGVAQSTVVTQAEWAVYMAQGLGLDWNLPPNAKSNHYLARLDWTNSVDFQAAQMLEGSTAEPREDGAISSPGTAAEALYEVSTLRAGDYGFRVKMGGGGAVLKVSDQTFELFQPENATRWVDLDRVPLTPGPHKMSLVLSGGATADMVGLTPPCMLPVEPLGGWDPLEPLTFEEMAVTVAKALDLEKNLPELGEPITIRGENFVRTLEYPYELEVEAGENEPYWLSAGGSIVTAVAKFKIDEPGVYSVEARYLSTLPLRWNMDSCLRVVTCPVAPGQSSRRRSMALELDAGEHEIEVTLPPGAKLDRIDVQRRDGSPEEYARVTEDEGFKLGNIDELVRRRDALKAARRLRDRFGRMAELRCDDELYAMENIARGLAASSNSQDVETPDDWGNVPDATMGTAQPGGGDAIFPVDAGQNPGTATPTTP